MKQLVILSDINNYNLTADGRWRKCADSLSREFSSITPIDTCELAGIQRSATKEEKHNQFVMGGLDLAARNLQSKINGEIEIAIGLSIGGVALWRAVQNGVIIRSLICLSSTRLRFETQPLLNTSCHLFFGSGDPYTPPHEWFLKMNQKEGTVAGHGHEFYKEEIGLRILKETIDKVLA